MKTIQFQDLKFQEAKNLNLKRAEAYFDNGLGISVIDCGFTYQVAVLEHKGTSRSVTFCSRYGGPIFHDYLEDDVNNKMKEIQEYLNHGRFNREDEDGTKRPAQQSYHALKTCHY